MSGAHRAFPVKIGERDEPLRRTTDYCNGERKPERSCAHNRLRCSTNRDPHRQRVLNRTRIHTAILEGLSQSALPGDSCFLANLEKHLKLFGKQLVVVVEIVSEQRIRFDE